MPASPTSRRYDRSRTLRALLPAWFVLVLAGWCEHPGVLLLLLAGNALAMVAVWRGSEIAQAEGAAQHPVRRAFAYGILLAACAGFLKLLFVAVAASELQARSLPQVLALSAGLGFILLVLARMWPAFALPFLWHDAWMESARRGAWLVAVPRRSLRLAPELTGTHELFFSCGLPAALGVLALVLGALSLAGLGPIDPGAWRLPAVLAYAALLVPAVNLLLFARTLRVVGLADGEPRAEEASEPAPSARPDPIPAAFADAPALQPAGPDALLDAARLGHVEEALAILPQLADPDPLPRGDAADRRSALIIAATLPDLRLLRALIAAGAEVNRRQEGHTALLAATRDSLAGRPQAVATLLANGADPRIADADGNSPLHHAARCSDIGVAGMLLDAGAGLDLPNRLGETPLGIACKAANWPLVELLLARGAQPAPARARPALLQAAATLEDDPSGVRLLLRRRVAVDAPDALSRTALLTAALAGHAAIAAALLEGGADVNRADSRGTTPLIEAARAGAADVVELLLAHGADPARVDAIGRNALIVACQSRNADRACIAALLEAGADPNRVDRGGKRALDHAAAAGRWALVALLQPDHELPSSIDPPDLPPTDSGELLAALLRGDWPTAASLSARGVAATPAERAELYRDLDKAGAEPARAWLLNRGVDAEARLDDGQSLFEHHLRALPRTAPGLAQLLRAGAQPGGVGVLASALAHESVDAQRTAVRRVLLELMERGADPCGRGPAERTALHLAVAAGEPALALRLLATGADPNALDIHGRTPLHLAAAGEARQLLPLVKALLRAGADPGARSSSGETPLGIALMRGESDLAGWLAWNHWPHPARALRSDDLVAAAAEGDLAGVERLHRLGLPLDGCDRQGAPALVRAAGRGHTALVVRLLELGADPGQLTKTGMHALAAAVTARRGAVVRSLLNHAVPADLRIASGATALAIAAGLGERALVEALLEAGADPNAADEQGNTPMHAAAEHAFQSAERQSAGAILGQLVTHGGRLSQRNDAGQDATLVFLGARANPGTPCHAEVLRALLEELVPHGIDLDVQDWRGVGLLHACAMHGLLGCARLLKAYGAPRDLVDGHGRRADEVAALLGFSEVASLLAPGD